MERRRASWIEELEASGEKLEWPSVDALAEEATRDGANGVEIGRRDWLKLLGGSLALAGLAGCSRERPRNILPYDVTPPELTPGVAQFYATSLELDGYGTGVLVETHEGRPTKVEGNPDHPASLGGSGPIEQAGVLGLYDPHRARTMRATAGAATFDRLVAALAAPRADAGAGLRFLLEPTSSPTIRALVAKVRERLGAARFTLWSPSASDAAIEGARLAFGRRLLPQRELGKAQVIVSVDADFLGAGPFWLRYARDYAGCRRTSTAETNRLYAVTVEPTATSTSADHRIRLAPSAMGAFVAVLAHEVLVASGARVGGDDVAAALGRADAPERQMAKAIAADLVRVGAAGLVIVGDRQPAEVHALAHLIHDALGNTEISWTIDPVLSRIDDAQDVASLANDMHAGKVDSLVVLGGDPAFTAPADLGFAEAMARVATRVVLGTHDRATARLATWFVNAAHSLEAWSDVRAYDGTASVIQPLIEPLFGGRTSAELLAIFAGVTPVAADLVRATWAADSTIGGASSWPETLRRGVASGTASRRATLKASFDGLAARLGHLGGSTHPGALEIAFAIDDKIHDGRFVDNPWLQELPARATKLTWDNAVLFGVETARRLGVATGDVVELAVGERRVEGPALVASGHAEDVLSLHLGYGQEHAGPVGASVGFDAYRLRTSQSTWSAAGASVRLVGRRHDLAITQLTRTTDGRDIAYQLTRAELAARSGDAKIPEEKRHLATLMPAVPMGGEQWAMTIDTSICTGCNACVVACQAENNILVVGKEQVLKSREMAWIRIDSYESGAESDPEVIHQPMLCQHCERAPCEYVCPVNATVHSPDGLNEMVYNRCVGTRFCSNNCPYKVRRFNWFDWMDREPANTGLVKMQKNPDVTVRQRGVMEKCSYCVQRIRETEIHARVERREIRDGEVRTACQQACPTEAIQFGSLRHSTSKMSMGRSDPRNYEVLRDLGTSPRTTYLARVTDPNPAIVALKRREP